jgi:uncharacterized protein (DUF2062 family)
VTVTGFARARHVLTRGGGAPATISTSPGDRRGGRGTGWCRGDGAAAIDGMRRVRPRTAPEPRVGIGALLGRNRAASACMDLSDGLADACGRSRRRRAPARIDARALPIPDAARDWFRAPASIHRAPRRGRRRLRAALRGAAARARRLATVIRQARGVPITRIGARPGAGPSRPRRRPEPLPQGSSTSKPMQTSPRTRRWLDQLLHTHDTPQRTAAAMRSASSSVLPDARLHTVLGLVFAFAFNLNRVAVLLGIYSNLPWILPAYYSLATLLGAAILGVKVPPNLWRLHGADREPSWADFRISATR